MGHSSRIAKRLHQRASSQARTEERSRIVDRDLPLLTGRADARRLLGNFSTATIIRLEKKRKLTRRRLYASERAKVYDAHDEVVALAQRENETRVRRDAAVGGSNP